MKGDDSSRSRSRASPVSGSASSSGDRPLGQDVEQRVEVVAPVATHAATRLGAQRALATAYRVLRSTRREPVATARRRPRDSTERRDTRSPATRLKPLYPARLAPRYAATAVRTSRASRSTAGTSAPRDGAYGSCLPGSRTLVTKAKRPSRSRRATCRPARGRARRAARTCVVAPPMRACRRSAVELVAVGGDDDA